DRALAAPARDSRAPLDGSPPSAQPPGTARPRPAPGSSPIRRIARTRDRRSSLRPQRPTTTATGPSVPSSASRVSRASRSQSSERLPTTDAVPIADSVVPADADVLEAARPRGDGEAECRARAVEEARHRLQSPELAAEPRGGHGARVPAKVDGAAP